MAEISRLRLRFATSGFIAEMRKQFASANPDKESPIKNVDDYPPDQISALMAGIARAIKYSGPESDEVFKAWLLREQEKNNER